MSDHLIITTIAHELGLKANQIASTVQLFDEDNTMPFIARYRKEVTGGLDEEQLRAAFTDVHSRRTWIGSTPAVALRWSVPLTWRSSESDPVTQTGPFQFAVPSTC